MAQTTRTPDANRRADAPTVALLSSDRARGKLPVRNQTDHEEMDILPQQVIPPLSLERTTSTSIEAVQSPQQSPKIYHTPPPQEPPLVCKFRLSSSLKLGKLSHPRLKIAKMASDSYHASSSQPEQCPPVKTPDISEETFGESPAASLLNDPKMDRIDLELFNFIQTGDRIKAKLFAEPNNPRYVSIPRVTNRQIAAVQKQVSFTKRTPLFR